MSRKCVFATSSFIFVSILLLSSYVVAKENIEKEKPQKASVLSQQKVVTKSDKELQLKPLRMTFTALEKETIEVTESLWQIIWSEFKQIVYSSLEYVADKYFPVGVIEVIDKFVEILHRIFDVNCYSTPSCPDGYIIQANSSHVPSSNGCGVDDFLLREWYSYFLPDEAFEPFEKCCHEHDVCYDTCGKDRDGCDVHLKRCLSAVCTIHTTNWKSNFVQGCYTLANIAFTATQAAGCQAFETSQANACLCMPVNRRLSDEL